MGCGGEESRAFEHVECATLHSKPIQYNLCAVAPRTGA